MNDINSWIEDNAIYCPYHKARISKQQCIFLMTRTYLLLHRNFYLTDKSNSALCSARCEKIRKPTSEEIKMAKHRLRNSAYHTGRGDIGSKEWAKKKSREVKGRIDSSKTRRNEEIVKKLKYKQMKDVAVEFKITPARVWQIKRQFVNK